MANETERVAIARIEQVGAVITRLERIGDARRASKAASADLRDAVRAASEAGIGPAEIARRAAVSYEWVYHLRKEMDV